MSIDNKLSHISYALYKTQPQHIIQQYKIWSIGRIKVLNIKFWMRPSIYVYGNVPMAMAMYCSLFIFLLSSGVLVGTPCLYLIVAFILELLKKEAIVSTTGRANLLWQIWLELISDIFVIFRCCAVPFYSPYISGAISNCSNFKSHRGMK